MIRSDSGTTSTNDGVPEDLLPMWSHWQLASGQLQPAHTLGDVRTNAKDGLWLGDAKLLAQAWQADAQKIMKLKFLVVEQRRIPQSTLDIVSELEHLERLYLTQVSSDSLQFLAKAKKLQYLCIESMKNLTAESPIPKSNSLLSLGIGTALTSLAPLVESFPYLRCLALQGTTEAKPACLDSLAPVESLQHLECILMMNCRTGDKRLSPLLNLPKLRTIIIGSERRWLSDDLREIKASGIAVSEFLDPR